jgi:hypothetical protein
MRDDMEIPQPTDLDFLLTIEDRPAAAELQQLSDYPDQPHPRLSQPFQGELGEPTAHQEDTQNTREPPVEQNYTLEELYTLQDDHQTSVCQKASTDQIQHQQQQLCIALEGNLGCGKSTILEALTVLLHPHQGWSIIREQTNKWKPLLQLVYNSPICTPTHYVAATFLQQSVLQSCICCPNINMQPIKSHYYGQKSLEQSQCVPNISTLTAKLTPDGGGIWRAPHG